MYAGGGFAAESPKALQDAVPRSDQTTGPGGIATCRGCIYETEEPL